MNVLLVIEGTYPWYRGGVSEWIYQYIKVCKNIDFTILQIATDPFFDLSPEDALYPFPDNISNFKRIEPPNLVDNWDTSLNSWFNDHRFEIKELAENNAIIHVTNTGFAGWLGVEIQTIKKIPLILTEHAIYWLEVLKGAVALECGYKIPQSVASKELIVTLFKDIARKVYKEANEVITVSECNIHLQEELGASDIQYIPNGIPTSWIYKSNKDRHIPVLGWVGRCAEMKNPLQFFDFVDEFENQGFKADFLMLLSGAGEKQLEEEVDKKALLYDSVTLVWNQPAKEYYKKMDMLLITSHNESQPLVMFEALSNMVLPIGREVGDLTNKYGLTFPKNDSIISICTDVIQFWNNTDEFLKYVENRFNLVKAKHTWPRIFSIYEDLIFKSIHESGK